VSTELQLAARCTAQAIRLRMLETELQRERAAGALLRIQVAAQQRKLADQRRVIVARGIRIDRLRRRLQYARSSRDLWRHRARVA
jgi:hypothetical protein